MNLKSGGELVGAYVVAGGAAILPQLTHWLGERGIEIHGNPDVYLREYKQCTVDDAREIVGRAQTRAVHGERRVFILVAPSVTVEAQNALLKTLEEPPAGAVFFLVVPSPQALLATVRSRAQTLSFESTNSTGEVDVKGFLAAATEKRLDMLKPLYTHDDNERDVRGAVLFLQGLEYALGKHVASAEARTGLEAVYRARKYMMDKGSLLKTLLEQVALLAPRL